MYFLYFCWSADAPVWDWMGIIRALNGMRRLRNIAPSLPGSPAKMEFCLILFWYGPTHCGLIPGPGALSLSLAAPFLCDLSPSRPEDNLSSSAECFNQPRRAQDTEIQIHTERINLKQEIFETFRRVSCRPNKWWRIITMDYLAIWSLSRFYIFPNDQALAIILHVHCSQPKSIFSISQKINK